MHEIPGTSITQLSERARVIFRDVVDSYLTTGAPVGSRTISRNGAIGKGSGRTASGKMLQKVRAIRSRTTATRL